MLLPVRTVGVMGDCRTYDSVCALRAVTSVDGMTADIYPFDAAFLSRCATRIINEVEGINRVVYDYTSEAARHDRVGVSATEPPHRRSIIFAVLQPMLCATFFGVSKFPSPGRENGRSPGDCKEVRTVRRGPSGATQGACDGA